MSFIRARAFRSLQQGLRSGGVRPVARVPAQSRAQLVARRWASTGGHSEHQASSDLPWLLSASVITPLGCYYLWPSASHAEAGHHDSHEEGHAEAEGKEEEAPAGEPEEEAKGAEQSEDDEQEKSEESAETAKPTGTEGDSQPKASDANKESSGAEESSEPVVKGGESATEGVKGKGHMKDDAPGLSHTSKREPDGKGGFKNRLDSGYATELGTGEQYADDESPKREAAASAKPTSDQEGDISNKQAGLSNTPTKHSTDIGQDPEKSKKGEGVPETAKVMGTVDPNRPQAESSDRGERQ